MLEKNFTSLDDEILFEKKCLKILQSSEGIRKRITMSVLCTQVCHKAQCTWRKFDFSILSFPSPALQVG